MINIKRYNGIFKLDRPYDFVLDGGKDKETKKDTFDRSEFYLEYFRNLSPSNFSVKKEGSKIIIEVPER